MQRGANSTTVLNNRQQKRLFLEYKKDGKNNKHKSHKIVPFELFSEIQNAKQAENNQGYDFLNSF